MLTLRWPFDGSCESDHHNPTRCGHPGLRDCSRRHGVVADGPVTRWWVTGPSGSASLDQRRFTVIVMRVQAASVFTLPRYLTFALYVPGFLNALSLILALPFFKVAR